MLIKIVSFLSFAGSFAKRNLFRSCKPAVFGFMLMAGAAAAQPPIEIWLSEGVGRFGDVTFYALGGKKTHPTPKGTFTVKNKHWDFYSNKYKSPMPRSIFFTTQCAIHVGSMRQKSHGCIHVDWETAEFLYYYAKTGKTKVVIHP